MIVILILVHTSHVKWHKNRKIHHLALLQERMKVWIVSEIYYAGGEIIGVYDSKQKAIKSVNESTDYNNDELKIQSFDSQWIFIRNSHNN